MIRKVLDTDFNHYEMTDMHSRLSEGAKTLPYRKRASADSGAEPKHYQRQYLKRKIHGLCTATGCPEKAASGHTKCHMHLDQLSHQHKQRYKARLREALCVNCGKRPGFWGVHCLICRPLFRKTLLPNGARRALRLYREAERQREIEHARVEARFAARKLLLTGEVSGKNALALRLYVGADDGIWRTYEDVGKKLRVSKEAVRMLLMAAKDALASSCDLVVSQPHRRLITSKNRETKKVVYKTRRAKGLCGYSGCSNQAASGHSQCAAHLQRMLNHALKKRAERIDQGLCIGCGNRPGFWGLRCILCRPSNSDNPLPAGARRALRQYRLNESRQQQREQLMAVRLAAVKLLQNEDIKGKHAQALRLYLGLDDGHARTYKEVGAVMGITRQRVQQLLHPAKLRISSLLTQKSKSSTTQESSRNNAKDLRVVETQKRNHLKFGSRGEINTITQRAISLES